MKKLREKGRMVGHKERGQKNFNEETDWKYFMRRSKQHADMAKKLKPDIVQLINEKQRKDMELLRQENENKKCDESDVSEDRTPPTEEELKIVRYEEERWCEEMRKEKKEKAANNRKTSNAGIRIL